MRRFPGLCDLCSLSLVRLLQARQFQSLPVGTSIVVSSTAAISSALAAWSSAASAIWSVGRNVRDRRLYASPVSETFRAAVLFQQYAPWFANTPTVSTRSPRYRNQLSIVCFGLRCCGKRSYLICNYRKPIAVFTRPDACSSARLRHAMGCHQSSIVVTPHRFHRHGPTLCAIRRICSLLR